MTSPAPPSVPRPQPAPRSVGPVVERLLAAEDRAVAVAAWWGARPTTPVVEPVPGRPDLARVTFLWRDAAAEQVLLAVPGLLDKTDPAASLMERLPGTDLWHLAYVMPRTWRASYAFHPVRPGEPPIGDDPLAVRAALDGGLPDPSNPATCRARSGALRSVVALPEAPEQPYLGAEVAGTVTEHLVDRRRVWLHRPPGEPVAGPSGRTAGTARPGPVADLPVVIALDGEVWTGPQSLPGTLSALWAAGAAPPCLTVLVDSGDRARRWTEQRDGGDLPSWLAGTLVPWLRDRGEATDPGRVVVVGQSLGGLTALRTVAERPDAATRFVAQSASLWAPGVVEELGARLAGSARGYLEVGTEEWLLLEPHRALRDRLAARGVAVTYREFVGGHDDACWRGGVADALTTILPPP